MGLIKGTVKLENDYKKFVEEYEKEKEKLSEIFNDVNIIIEHMGSTSVEGLKAKPIIDVAIGVTEFEDFNYYVNLFSEYSNYEVRNCLDIDEILIVKGDENYTSVLIHLMELDSDRYKESILFRDYLRKNKKVLLEYQELKEELALRYPNDRPMYTKSKNDFIKNVIKIANKNLPVNLFELDHVLDDDLTRVVLVCRYKDKWLLCKHKERGTWEIPGGHIEAGEEWLSAAKRELFEETGVSKVNIERICFYKISTYGLICFADILELGNNELFHEMDEVALFDELPLNMTYYDTHKMFIEKVAEVKSIKNYPCIFCAIAKGDEKSFKIYESENIFAFLDSDPINEGHILIITKDHFLDVDEIENVVLDEINVLIKKIVKTLKSIYKLDGYSIMQNGGKFNDIGHYHLHVFPRYVGDGFSWVFDESDKEFNEKIQNKILSELDKNM